MLDNEPEGGERTGAQPADETADNTGTAPTRRPRATRRRAAPLNQPEQTGGPVQASADAGSNSGESPQAEVLAPVSGDLDVAPKTPRRRRKATAAESPAEATAEDGPLTAAEVVPATAEVVPPVKVTRTRRRKAVAEPAAQLPLDAAAETPEVDPAAPEAAAPTLATTAPEAAPPPRVTRRRGTAAARAAQSTPPQAENVVPAVPVAEDEPVEPAAAPLVEIEAVLPPAAPSTEPPAAPTRATRTTRRTRTSGAASQSGEVPAGVAVPEEPAATVEPATPVPPAEPPVVATPTEQPASDQAGAGAEEPPRRRRRAAIVAPTVLFMAPEPETIPIARVTEPAPVAPEPDEPVEPTRRRRRARRGAEAAEPEPEVVIGTASLEPAEAVGADEEAESADLDDEDDDDSAAGRRRRRRGRRGRGRGKGGADDADEDDSEETAEADAETEAEAEGDEEESDGGDGLTRRRRRRRRKGSGDTDSAADDGVPTVVKIREPRRTVDEVQGVSGSTRLEAKRQRRRDGREQRRTRPPILSESEFLARREAVDRMMVVRQRGDRTQIAVLEDGVLVEHYVTRNSSGTMAGNVYLGKVQNVLPSMEAAFVDVGRGRNAVLYAGEVNWDSSGLEGRARSIEQALRSGDSVLVQVTKDPIGHKGARLTSHIALSGRHLVYVPNGNASGISRKLPDNERKRLRDVLKKLVPDGAGVIVRTAAEGASEDELARDVTRLQAQWESIQAKATEGGAPALLYEEPDLVIRVVRDLFNEDFRELVVQGEDAYEMVESYLSHVSPDLVTRLRRHVGTADVFAESRIDEQILKGLDRKVFLPSGGHLVIDRTEAMTVVDVNTGKYTGAGGNLEETVTRNNLEAAEEIVRQLRLRDLGGIVVIDFIDMVLESNRELVLRRLTECLGRDRTKHQVTEITSLGLVQMTRKRIGAGLLEAFSETCDCCKGRGLIIHTEPVPEKRNASGERHGPADRGGAPERNGAGERNGSAERNGAAEKVKAVATATGAAVPPVTESANGVTRRRTRKASAPERPLAEVTEADDDTMGYDLSRYEVDTPAVTEAESEPAGSGGSARLAGTDDPDALGDGDGDADDQAGAGRRRSRRGGTRRRTRP